MKSRKLILTLMAIFGLATVTMAQTVETFTISGKTYYGTKAIPPEIEGEYLYDKTKAPRVVIKKDGTGVFQVHDVPEYPAEYWIETDEKGVPQKKTSETNSNYQYVLILKYGDNGQTGWRGAMKNSYTRIEVTMAISMGYAIVMGERYRKL